MTCCYKAAGELSYTLAITTKSAERNFRQCSEMSYHKLAKVEPEKLELYKGKQTEIRLLQYLEALTLTLTQQSNSPSPIRTSREPSLSLPLLLIKAPLLLDVISTMSAYSPKL